MAVKYLVCRCRVIFSLNSKGKTSNIYNCGTSFVARYQGIVLVLNSSRTWSLKHSNWFSTETFISCFISWWSMMSYVLAIMFWPWCFDHDVLAMMFWPCSFGHDVLAMKFWPCMHLSLSAMMFWLWCFGHDVMAMMFWTRCIGHDVLAMKFWP